MRVLIIGSLAGELGQAARISMDRGARLDQADNLNAALTKLRANAQFNLILCDVAHDIAQLVQALVGERFAVPVVACGADVNPDQAAQAVRDGARDFLPLPPDPELIAAILEAAAGE